MASGILFLTLGGIMVYSALKGLSIADVFAGVVGNPLDPRGSHGNTGDTTNGSDVLPPSSLHNIPGTALGKYAFKGPHAILLANLSGLAETHYHLRVTATTGGNHVPNSYHYQGRAFDVAGPESDMRAFARMIYNQHRSQTLELIHNPGPAIKNGVSVDGPTVYAAVWAGHRDHVHVAA